MNWKLVDPIRSLKMWDKIKTKIMLFGSEYRVGTLFKNQELETNFRLTYYE